MLPELILDSDSFENLIEEYRSQIAGIYPDWTDYNYHDPGITFLELFAWMQENQQYYMQQLGEAHYRQFFRMAGVKPQRRTPAKVLAEAVTTEQLCEFSIPCGTVFISGGLPFETVRDELLPAAEISSVERCSPDGRTEYIAETDISAEQEAFSLTAFGENPKHGAAFILHISGDLRTDTDMHLSLTLKNRGRNPADKRYIPSVAALDWEYKTADGWQPVTVIEDETYGLLYSGRIRFRLEKGSAACGNEAMLRVVFSSGVYDAAPVILGLSLREIELRQSRTVKWQDGRQIAFGNGFPNQEYPLPSEHFLTDSVEIIAEDILNKGHFELWKKTDELLESGPEDKCYMLDEQSGTVRFGDGFHGLPPEGRILVTALSETEGKGGNIKEHSLFMAEDRNLRTEGIPSFRLKRRIEAGMDPEKTEETLLRMAHEIRHIHRAVSCADYERIVRMTPGLIIHSAHAWTEDHDPNTVYIAVRPGSGNQTMKLTEGIKDAVAANLEEHRLLGTSFILQSPEYIRVDISCEAVPTPNYRDTVMIIETELKRFFESIETKYGAPLEFSALYGRLNKLPCVKKIIALQTDPVKAGIRRNPNGDLIPPPGGVFLPGKIDTYLNFYGD